MALVALLNSKCSLVSYEYENKDRWQPWWPYLKIKGKKKLSYTDGSLGSPSQTLIVRRKTCIEGSLGCPFEDAKE